jgi:hypothetical protein
MVRVEDLKNPGFEWWLNNVGYKLPDEKEGQRHLVLSLYSQKKTRLCWFSEMLDSEDLKNKLVGVELNFFFPNEPDFSEWKAEEIIKSCEAIKNYARHPVFCRLSAGQKKLVPEICRQAKGLIDVFTIGSTPWSMVFPGQQSPFVRLGGGVVCGQAAQKVNWNFAQYLTNISDIPVVWPVGEERDIVRARSYGAKVFGFGTILRFDLPGPSRWVKRDMEERQIQRGKS